MGKETGSSTICVMIELQVPSNKRSLTGSTEVIAILLSITKTESRKQWEEPESIRVQVGMEYVGRESIMNKESGVERVDALS